MKNDNLLMILEILIYNDETLYLFIKNSLSIIIDDFNI